MPRIMDVSEVSLILLKGPKGYPNGLHVHAKGHVPTTGWSEFRLEPYVYIVPPVDGFLDLDFRARAPTGIVGQVLLEVHASAYLKMPDWLNGVRIHAKGNALEAADSEEVPCIGVHGGDLPFPFSYKRDADHSFAEGGIPGPWPFPW